MKVVTYEDKDGKLHRVLLRDNDPETLAEEGIPFDPPSIEDILEKAKIELHNELVRRELFDVKSINQHSGALSSAVKKCITNKIIQRYLLLESTDNKEKDYG